MQAVSPLPVPYWPPGQLEQEYSAVAPVGCPPEYMYLPAAQAVQADSALEPMPALYLPSEHPVHVTSVLVAALYCPAGQFTHEPEDLRWPGPHSPKVVLVPVVLEPVVLEPVVLEPVVVEPVVVEPVVVEPVVLEPVVLESELPVVLEPVVLSM